MNGCKEKTEYYWPDCPLCGQELDCADAFFMGADEGLVYICDNESCHGYTDETLYHTHKDNPSKLHKGHPVLTLRNNSNKELN